MGREERLLLRLLLAQECADCEAGGVWSMLKRVDFQAPHRILRCHVGEKLRHQGGKCMEMVEAKSLASNMHHKAIACMNSNLQSSEAPWRVEGCEAEAGEVQNKTEGMT